MSTFSVLFLAALLIATGMRLWLATRHVQHIWAHRDAVPSAFADEISLEAHRKAADYSIAKTRLNVAAIVFDAAVLLALTFGGGLQAIDDLVASFYPEGIARGVLFVAILTVKLKNVSGLDDFVELDEPLYALSFVWLFFSGAGWLSVDDLFKRALKSWIRPERSQATVGALSTTCAEARDDANGLRDF